MTEFDVIPGNKAVAEGVRLARVEVIPAYPITPQTTIIEYLADFVAKGELKAEYVTSDGEHSCMGMAVAASLVGARTFTASSSQGVAYMHEVLAQAPSYRTPIVLAVTNRVLGWYWALGPDFSDVAPEINLGWIVAFVESNQEALDMVLQLYKVAEDRRILLPAMLNLDGYYLSYSYEQVVYPDQAAVDTWLPAYKAPYPMDPTQGSRWPASFLPAALHTTYRRLHEEVLHDAKAVIREVDESFAATFGRRYGGLVEEYRCEDADAVLVTMSSLTTAARRAVDRLRAEGHRIGLVKLRFLRPFPAEEFQRIASRVKAIGVVDRMVLHGTNRGMAYADLLASLYGHTSIPLLNFIAGMGGEDVSIDEFRVMGLKALEAAEKGAAAQLVHYVEHAAPKAAEPVRVDSDSPQLPGSEGCAGCGASIIVRQLLDVLGPDTIIANPPSCSVVNYPGNSRVPWMLTNFAAGAAYATGAYRALKAKGRADRVFVSGFAGDGGTVDIGLQSLSGAAERGESIIWLCYDNEAYMNTGVQRSGSTPLYSNTTSTPVGQLSLGKQVRRKNMGLIMAAHRIPYMATASPAYLPDLRRKIEKAAEVTRRREGLAFLHVQQPCATGWYFPPEKTVTVARLAVQSGAWPLYEIDHGAFRLSVKPRELKPVSEYIRMQDRFRHLTDEQLSLIQSEVQQEWQALLQSDGLGRLAAYSS